MITFLTNNPMYVVLTTTLLIWAGIAFYLMRIDNRISRIGSKQ